MRRIVQGYVSTIYGIKFEGRIVYVGSTAKSLNTRLGEHYQMAMRGASKSKLYTWMREKNPALTIVELEKSDAEKRFERETFYMHHYDTINSGFNCEIATHQGRPKGCHNPTGADHYLYGKKMPEHIIEASRRAHLGTKLSEEHKRKLHAAGRAASLKKVLRSDGVVFDSMGAAAEAVGVSISAISVAVKRHSNCKGYQFEFVNRPVTS